MPPYRHAATRPSERFARRQGWGLQSRWRQGERAKHGAAVCGFYLIGPPCRDARAVTVSSGTRRSGLRLLRNEPLVNLLAIPERDAGLLGEVGQHLFEIADT